MWSSPYHIRGSTAGANPDRGSLQLRDSPLSRRGTMTLPTNSLCPGGRAIAFTPPATSSEPNRDDHLRHFVRQVCFGSRFLVNYEDDLRRSVISIGFPSCAGARIVGSFRMRNRHSPRTTIGPEAYSYCRVLGGRFVLCARYFCAGSLNSQPCTPNLKHSQGPCSEPP